MTCQLGTLTEVRPLDFDNVKNARGHKQYFFTPYQLNQGRKFMHTSCKAQTSVYVGKQAYSQGTLLVVESSKQIGGVSRARGSHWLSKGAQFRP